MKVNSKSMINADALIAAIFNLFQYDACLDVIKAYQQVDKSCSEGTLRYFGRKLVKLSALSKSALGRRFITQDINDDSLIAMAQEAYDKLNEFAAESVQDAYISASY